VTADITSWGQALVGGLVGAVVGAVASARAIVYQQGKSEESAREGALAALAVELEHVINTGANPKPLAFAPVPSDAYRQAMPYIGRLPEDVRLKVLKMGSAVSAYNAAVEYYNPLGPQQYSPKRENQVRALASDATSKATDALAALRCSVPTLAPPSP
jgi:hypothetical protein